MPARRTYLKLAAFVPAIVLVVGFVGYRAGAFELPWLSESAPPSSALSDSPLEPVAGSPETLHVLNFRDLSEEDLQLLAGSKSSPIVKPSKPGDKPPAFMGGSKSAWIYTPPTPNSGTQPPVPEKPPVYMGGSKTKMIFDPLSKPGAQPAPTAPANPPPLPNQPKP